MSKEQLEALKKKIGRFPQVRQNGLLLHVSSPLAEGKEWSVLSYNLNVLGDLLRENIQLRRKLDDLVDMYTKKMETFCYMRPAGYDEYPMLASNSCNPKWIWLIIEKLEDLEKKVDNMDDMVKEKLGEHQNV